MDELIIAGKRYISSKRASELTGYVKDYVGQLIRQGKIQGTRVGRAWYVDMQEILKHSGREESHIVENATPDEAPYTAPSGTSRLTPAMIQSQSLPRTWGPVTYETESVDLFPQKFSATRITTETEESSQKMMAKISEIDEKVSLRIPEKTSEVNVISQKSRGALSESGKSQVNIVRSSSQHSLARSPTYAGVNSLATTAGHGKSRRLIVSVALLFLGIVAFSSVVTSLFVSKSLVSMDGSGDYTAPVAIGAEYLVEILRSLR